MRVRMRGGMRGKKRTRRKRRMRRRRRSVVFSIYTAKANNYEKVSDGFLAAVLLMGIRFSKLLFR